MSTTTLPPPPVAASPVEGARAAAVPWYIHAVLFASASVVAGVIWDISWHKSIGRDTLFSPPHLAIYLGGIVAGVACGWKVLRTSFGGSDAERASAVGFWKFFRGPLGAWACIWGAFAMLTSAPFDDWWHNAYGLDVEILSPPHVVLALGILAIQVGALLMVLALQNREAAEAAPDADGGRTWRLRWMFVLAVALVLLNFEVLSTEYTYRVLQHRPSFYIAVSLLFPFVLVAAARAGRLRWSATAAAGLYMAAVLLAIAVLPLFPAEPKLAPVRFPLDRMVPPQFPLLLIVPALAIDLVERRFSAARRRWTLAALLGAVFLGSFLLVQWPMASLMLSEFGRDNWLFGTHLRPYWIPDSALSVRGEFYDAGMTPAVLTRGLLIALVIGILSARAGLAWGDWMRKVRR